MSINGSHLFRIIVESILRGGIKSIPFVGSGVDQATFGIKDAISNAEVKDLMEKILNQVNEVRPTKGSLKDQEIKAITDNLIEKLEVRDLVKQLQNINLSTLRDISKVLASIQALTVKADTASIDFKAISENVVSGNRRILNKLNQSILFNQREYTRIQDSLSYVANLLIEYRQSRRRNLREIYDALNELNTSILDLSGYSFRVALDSLPLNKELTVTVDFSELYRYAFSPYLEDPLAPVSVYFIHNSHAPLFLLPASLIEMERYLSRQLSVFVDRKKLIERLSVMLTPSRKQENDHIRPFGDINKVNLGFLADLTMHKNSPLQRMKKLFKTGLIKHWNKVIPDVSDFQEYFDVVFKHLCEYRKRITANFIDAVNLSLLGFLNAHSNSSQPKLIHVSGAKSMEYVAGRLSSLNEPYFGTEDIPLVVHPLTWSYRTYLPKIENDFEHTYMISVSKDVEMLSSFVRYWIDRLKNPDWDEMQKLSDDLRRIYNSLAAFWPTVEPFHRQILETEIADLSIRMKPFGVTLWEKEFNKAIDEAICIIIDMLAHVEPLVYKMKAFSAFARQFAGDTENSSVMNIET